MVLHARSEEVLRVKGLLDVGEAGPVLLNGVQHVIHPPEHLEEWPDEDDTTRIVFITMGIRSEELLTSLEAFRCIVGRDRACLKPTRSCKTGTGWSRTRGFVRGCLAPLPLRLGV
jgi:hypothetical protein